MLLTASDVIMRYFFHKPITGSFELTEYLMVIIISFTLAYGAASDRLVRVTIISDRLPIKAQSIISILSGILGIVFFVFITWRSITFAGLERSQNISSPILGIPRFPFAVVVVMGMACLVLVLIVEWLQNLAKVLKK